MNSNQVILWMIIICIGFMVLTLLIKPIRTVGKLLINSFLGIVALFIFNFLLAPIGISIGINVLNAFIVGLLGIPGFISLFILSFVL
jgi:inhibitor of the pro-sigma K processing machinery